MAVIPKDSRTAKSLTNVKFYGVFIVLKLLMQFLSRKVFLDYLGTEILGLNSTAANFMEMLNLAELGVMAGVRFMLYKPCRDRDYRAINEILSLQGHIYKFISTVVIALALVVSAFFPWIFDKMTLPLWYAYASFGAMMYGYMTSNFINYRQVMFFVTQQQYKIITVTSTITITRSAAQMFAMWLFSNGYLCWLTLEVAFSTLEFIIIHLKTRRYFPMLESSPLSFRELNRKYHILAVKVKQLLFHRLASIALLRSLPVVIYALISLTEVALYGNYMMIVKGIETVAVIVFDAVSASVGDLVAENNREKSIRVFHEIFSIRFLSGAVLCFALLILSQPFVTLWIGAEYKLGYLSVTLIVFSLFLKMLRNPFDIYIQAYGMFQDVWAPVFETAVNLGCAIAGGIFWGLNGILAGSCVGTFFIVFFWKPVFLFGRGFNAPLGAFIKQWGVNLFACALAAALTLPITYIIPVDPASGWGAFIAFAFPAVLVYTLILAALTWLTDRYFRIFIARFI